MSKKELISDEEIEDIRKDGWLTANERNLIEIIDALRKSVDESEENAKFAWNETRKIDKHRTKAEKERDDARIEAFKEVVQLAKTWEPKCIEPESHSRYCKHCTPMGDAVDLFGQHIEKMIKVTHGEETTA